MDAEVVDETLFEQWMAAKARNEADLGRAETEAEARQSRSPMPKEVRDFRLRAASHLATARFYQRQAADEPEAWLRAIHRRNAETYLRLSREAEAEAARLMPPQQQRALVPSLQESIR